MDREEFVEHVGPQLVHLTMRSNVPGINAGGLIRAAEIARRAGIDPRSLRLRKERTEIQLDNRVIKLNHQRPLIAGAKQAETFLDRHTLESWSDVLNSRLFFWPTDGGSSFADSLKAEAGIVEVRLDSRRFFDAFAPDIDLSPINSGSATRRASVRGDWLFVPVSEGWDAFAENRRKRGHAGRRDSVAEVSIARDIPPEIFRTLMLAPGQTAKA
ncbi:hypothetical protein FHY55_12210 [Oceanicola sp. D3]|uniref:DUF7002 family protein n=1 Tax=Oceanicola sp. D3 TaxID=2587163 RepID=UPI00111F961B|nr:hypothetical protein [Oceanicola sp. D3]QDC09959.1 hypothetical protein FHY55_12210 [Oceanicola sp. D3]